MWNSPAVARKQFLSTPDLPSWIRLPCGFCWLWNGHLAPHSIFRRVWAAKAGCSPTCHSNVFLNFVYLHYGWAASIIVLYCWRNGSKNKDLEWKLKWLQITCKPIFIDICTHVCVWYVSINSLIGNDYLMSGLKAASYLLDWSAYAMVFLFTTLKAYRDFHIKSKKNSV